MRIQAYLRIASDNLSVSLLHKEIATFGTSIMPLKTRREGTDEFWWVWQTDRVTLNEEDVDGGVKELLKAYRPFFPVIRKYQSGDAVIVLQIVTLYKPTDRPAGLFLSADTISLLNELGCALDDDVVPDVST